MRIYILQKYNLFENFYFYFDIINNKSLINY